MTTGATLATVLVRTAGLIYRPRRQEFAGELSALQNELGETGLGYAVGTVMGAAIERVTTVGQPLRIRDATKSFGGTTAVRGVSLEVPAGSVTALLGGNGAGKSTLLRMIAGTEVADSGTLYLGDTPITARDVDVHASIVPADLKLFDDLTVAQNLAIGRAERSAWIINADRERERAHVALRRVGSSIDPTIRVRDLTLPDQIVVAIARAMQRPCPVVVLDEPTGSLSEPDSAKIFGAVAALRRLGVSIVYVSHRIDEVFSLADRVAVLRDGELVHEGPIADTSPAAVVRHIVGDDVEI